ncbi:MAG: T9SS type A sorting domain-containing protein [Candidatus Delongbacteria bacterium]|nr:T9SS type A sorting domain-containing protein [Candidatus Delongbacteria bacterium]
MKKLIFVLILTIVLTLFAQIWTRNGPYSAHVLSLAVAPSDSNVIYIGTLGDGVYKSTDMAENWMKCSTVNLPEWPDSLDNSPTLPCWWFGENYPINDIAIDPNNSEHLWIGFGSRGLFESSDGGNNWQRTDPSLPDTLDVDFIHVNSDNTDKIFTGAGGHNYNENQPLENGGLYYTENGGNNWALVDSVPHGSSYSISNISIEPGNEDHILIGVSSSGEPGFSWGLMESMDCGANWTELSEEYTYYDISANPSNNQNIYSIIYTGWMDWYLAESDDGGTTWIPDYTEDWVTSLYADKEFNLYAAEGWENTLNGNVKKSTDAGNSWTYIDTFCAGRGVNLRNRCETSYLNVDNIYFGTYCGTYKSNDGGLNCVLKNKNIFNSYIQDIEIHPYNNNIVYAGGYQGFWKSNDGCDTWNQVNEEDVYVIRYDQNNPDTLYYGGQHLKRSYDGGTTFTDIRNNIIGDIRDIKIDFYSNNVIYVTSLFSTGYILYKSVDYGNEWEVINSCPLKSYPLIFIDPNHPDTLYFSNQRSLDGGNTWSDIVSSSKEVVAVHPFDSNIIFFSDRNELTVTYDWGKTFEIIDEYLNWPGVPVPAINNLAFDKTNPDIMLYCTPNNGIHNSSDAGKNWFILDGSYEKRTLDAIPVPNEDKIYIATHGDGVWIGENISLGIDNGQVTIDNYILQQNYPNPFNPVTEIEYSLKNSGLVKISIFNSKGQFVTDIVNQKMSTGIHRVNFNAEKLNSGIYFYQLSVDGVNLRSKKMLYLR